MGLTAPSASITPAQGPCTGGPTSQVVENRVAWRISAGAMTLDEAPDVAFPAPADAFLVSRTTGERIGGSTGDRTKGLAASSRDLDATGIRAADLDTNRDQNQALNC